MSLNDFSDLEINENESNDRSLSEWNFRNSLTYWTDQDAESSLDINDVNLELIQADTLIQNSTNICNSENFIRKKLSQNNVQGKFTINTISDSKIPIAHYQKKKKGANSGETNYNENATVLETGMHISHLHLDTKLDSNVKDYPVISNSSHHNKGIIGCWNKNMSDENLNLLSYPTETSNNDIKENPLRRYYSTLSLKEPNINPKVSVHPSSHSSISKSRSLSNLSTCKPSNYDHIQSKVKKYIQDQKRESKLRRESKLSTKSLPVTPVKSIASRGFLDLDEDYLQKLCLSSKKQKEDLPEDLKKIKQEILNGNVNINLVENLFSRLEKEREYRISQDIILNAFQLHYDNLLGKYAEAKNDMDYLRFNRDANCSGEYSQAAKLGKFSNFKKAYSTSNIFAECSIPFEFGSAKTTSNLVRHSSSPHVHPEITEESQEKFDGKLSHLNESFINECSFSGSSTSNKDVNDWYEKFNHLGQKLKEYLILENNSAFNKVERETVWKYILKLYSKLYKAMPPVSNCKLKFEEISESINVVARNYALHLPQDFPLDDSKSAISTSGFCENLPTNSSYPKVTHDSHCQDKLDFLKPNFSALTNNSRTNDKSKLGFLKYSNTRDADSGCPPSDRSTTRNSHFPSFDPFESLSTNGIGNEVSLNANEVKYRGMGYGEVWRRQSIDNLLQVSDNGRSTKWNSRKKNYLRNSRSKSLMSLDEDYDASGSSEFEDPVDVNDKTRKCVRKKPLKSPKTTKYLSRYEDKFICQDQIVSSDSHSSKYEGKCGIDMSQMEKNSKYFEYQVKDLKSKGLLRKRNDKSKRFSLPNRPNTPLKALADEPLKLGRMSLDVNDLPIMSLVSNEKQLPNLSMFSGKTNTTESDESKLYNKKSFSFSQKHKNKLLSTSTPKSSLNFEKPYDSTQSKERCSLSSDLSFDKTKNCNLNSYTGDSEMQANKSTGSVSHSCHMKRYVLFCCCHSNQLPIRQCLQASCGHKAGTSDAKTEVGSEKLITCLNKVTEEAEKIRTDTQSSVNRFRSRMLPVTRH